MADRLYNVRSVPSVRYLNAGGSAWIADRRAAGAWPASEADAKAEAMRSEQHYCLDLIAVDRCRPVEFGGPGQ